MPIFEYHCPQCNTTIEKIRPFESRRSGGVCYNCSSTLEFVDKIHASTFQLKGTGWYETDFKGK